MAARINWGGLTRGQRERVITEYVNSAIFLGEKLELEAIKTRVFELMYNDGCFDKWREKKRDRDGFFNHWNHKWIAPFIQRIIESRKDVAASIGSLKQNGINYTVSVFNPDNLSGSSANGITKDSLDDLKTDDNPKGKLTTWLIVGGLALLALLLFIKKRNS